MTKATDSTATEAKMSAEDLRAKAKVLFEQYEAASEEEKQLDDMMAGVRTKKSAAVKGIEALLGKGPFEYKGQELIITKRNDNWYFRVRGQSSVTVID